MDFGCCFRKQWVCYDDAIYFTLLFFLLLLDARSSSLPATSLTGPPILVFAQSLEKGSGVANAITHSPKSSSPHPAHIEQRRRRRRSAGGQGAQSLHSSIPRQGKELSLLAAGRLAGSRWELERPEKTSRYRQPRVLKVRRFPFGPSTG